MATKRSAVAVAVAAAVLAVGGCTGDSGGDPAQPESSAPGGAGPGRGLALQTAFEDVVGRVLPSVVQITGSTGLGSGIVFDDHGHIVTNAHVVASDRTFRVSLSTGETGLPATLVAGYPPGDLAVIKLDDPPDSLRAATFADSDKVRVGQVVMAMGNPLGLSGSVTEGIVSGIGRTVTEPRSAQSPGATIIDAIQTSAPINPGNSGGALVDLDGKVIGVPTLAASDPEVGGVAPGIGFAIPSNTVKDIATQIVRNGEVVASHRAALDITARTVVDSDGRPTGVGVARVVDGGAAAEAGIRAGDIITAIEDTTIRTTGDLSAALAGYAPGDKVSVSLRRADGSTTTVTVALGELR